MKKDSRLAISRWLRWFLFAVAIIAVYKSFDNLGNIFSWVGNIFAILTPFLIAFAIAYFLNKPTSKLEHFLKKAEKTPEFFKKHSRGTSVLTIYLVFLLIIYFFLSLILPPLVKGIVQLVTHLPEYFGEFNTFISNLMEEHEFLRSMHIPERVTEMIDTYVKSLTAQDLTGYINQIISFGNSLINILLSFFISLYMLLEKESLIAVVRRFLALFLPENKIMSVSMYLKKTDGVVYNYFTGQFLDCIIVSIMASIWIYAIGAPYALVLGFIFGMFNIIPYFGPIISGAGVVLVIFVSNVQENFWLALIAAAGLLVLQQVDANLINPKILSNALDMNPFWVILAITVGSGLFGFLGMLVAVPCMAVFRIFFRDIVAWRKRKKKEKIELNRSITG